MYGLENNSIDLILTDIPYGKVSQNGEERAKYEGQLRKINKGSADIETFNLYDFLDECYRVCRGTVYIFCGIEQVSTVFTYFYEKKDMMTRQCAWKKTNPAPSNGQYMWLSSMENCIFAKKRKTTFNESCKSAIWELPVGRSKIFPTEKPLGLFERLILASSNENDIILDPCIGSGTTAEACIKNNRNFIGFEIDKDTYKIAQDRVNNIYKSI
jgi:site-specific DNA-methyltransferase (adenine-specific)